MTINEFSTEFDVLYNNITSNQATGLNEYEKSVFLTKAQEQLLNEYFNIRADGVGGGFDGSQKRQYDFSSIIHTKETGPISSEDIQRVDSRSILVLYPDDYFLSVNEILKDDYTQYTVIPLSYTEYATLMLKPYAYPVRKAVWRLFNSRTESSQIVAELIGKFNAPSSKFIIRYIKKPAPIILENLEDYGTDLTINGETAPTECELPSETHREILERAVTLAKITWLGGTATQAAAQQKDNK